jgi:hypothetical protein
MMVWAWTMPARHPEPDREVVRDGGSAGVLDALDPMPVAARTLVWCFSSAGLARLQPYDRPTLMSTGSQP